MARPPGLAGLRWTGLPLGPGAPVRVASASRPRPGGGVRVTTLGADRTVAGARRRARAEAIERLAGFFRRTEPRVRATRRELGEAAIDPAEVLLYSRRQLARGIDRGRVVRAFDPARSMDWTALWSLTNSVRRFLPTRLIYYGCPAHPGSAFGRADSNGVAAGRTVADATVRALLELIERDAVALWWYRRAPRPALGTAVWRGSLADRIRRWFESQGRACWALDLTSDLGVPVVAAVSAIGDGDIRLGFGAGFDRKAALERAMLEMAQLTAIAGAADRRSVRLPPDLGRWLREVDTAGEPQLVPARAGATASRCRPGGTAVARLSRLVSLLARSGLEVLAVELSRPEFALKVVRVVVPGLRPWWRRLAPGRLYSAPVAAGWLDSEGNEPAVNPRSLPF